MSKPKVLSEYEWVRLAASTDEARPVLCGVHVSGETLEATDGHRLHVGRAGGSLSEGIWHWRTLERIAGNYPETAQVVPSKGRKFLVRDHEGLRRAVGYALAIYRVSRSFDYGRVTLLVEDDKRLCVNPVYLKDALAGMTDDATTFMVTNPFSPVRIDMGPRKAVLMPVRMSPDVRGVELRIDEWLEEQLEIPVKEPAKPKRKAKAQVA